MPNKDDMFNAALTAYGAANKLRVLYPGEDLHDPAKSDTLKQRVRTMRTDADNLDIAASAVDFISSDTDLMRRFTAFRNGERCNG